MQAEWKTVGVLLIFKDVNIQEIDLLEGLRVNRRKILGYILFKWVSLGIGLIRLNIFISGEPCDNGTEPAGFISQEIS